MTKNYIIISITLFLMLFNFSLSNAQTESNSEEKTSPFKVGTDVVSRYVWRGMNIAGESVHLQPSMKVGIANTGIEVGAWGSYGISNGFNESDLYIAYTPISAFTFTLNDYFVPANSNKQKYFEWQKDSTIHTIETIFGFNGTEKIPFTLLFAVNVYGLDAKNKDNKIVYSKYVEMGYAKEIRKTNLKVFLGACLDKPEEGMKGYYGQTDIGVINLGLTVSKAIEITDKYSLPIYTSIVTNPQAENIYIVFGITF